MPKWDYKEKKSITYEIVATQGPNSGYRDTKIVYRFWPAGDGDWKIQVIDSDKAPIEPILIPAKVLERMLNVNVKEDLKK